MRLLHFPYWSDDWIRTSVWWVATNDLTTRTHHYLWNGLDLNQHFRIFSPAHRPTLLPFLVHLPRFELGNSGLKPDTVADYVIGAYCTEDGTRTHKTLASKASYSAIRFYVTSACCAGEIRTPIAKSDRFTVCWFRPLTIYTFKNKKKDPLN